MKSSFFFPGRVNLIGEHIDYNGGLVLPTITPMGITLEITPREDDLLVFSSENQTRKGECALNEPWDYLPERGWANYPLGMLQALRNQGVEIKGMSLHYSSTLPMASGLSSSACIEVLTGYAILQMAGVENPDMKDLALLAQQVENQYIGVNCGIMDQFAIALGKPGQALLLDCASQAFEYVPFDLEGYRLVIMDTRVPRSLAASKYNERRAECEEALAILQGGNPDNPKPNLCAFTVEELSHSNIEKNSPIYRRARHAITEQARVLEAVKVLRAGDALAFGALMSASHQSLQMDYEVSCYELDFLVSMAQLHEGCVGARMTGAGFGGCAIALVKTASYNQFTRLTGNRYRMETGLEVGFY